MYRIDLLQGVIILQIRIALEILQQMDVYISIRFTPKYLRHNRALRLLPRSSKLP